MSTTVNNQYGSYNTVVPQYLTDYGVFDDKYGVITEPETNSYLLTEDNNFLVQENGGKLILGDRKSVV